MEGGKQKKVPCPFDLGPLESLPSDESSFPARLNIVVEVPPDQFQLDISNQVGLKQELEVLLQNTRDQLGLLKDRAKQLKTCLKESFEIEDAEKWLNEQHEMRAREKSITLSLYYLRFIACFSLIHIRRPTEVLNSKANPSSSSGPAPTTLRIKLVDKPTSGKSSSSSGQPVTAVGRGAGSKNLSRMNRPQEATEGAKNKAINQIPINIFWNQVEAFFKPIEDADLKFLCDPARIIDPTPFVIPPLGKPFLEQWKHQYGYTRSGIGDKSQTLIDTTSDQFKPSLKERLLSLLMDEDIPLPETCNSNGTEESVVIEQESSLGGPQVSEFVHLDDRLRHELSSIGVEEFSNVTIDLMEDDQICVEIRNLQRQLRERVAVNYYRKRRLCELAKEKLPAQEFYSLLSDLDKQLEQIYLRRTRSGKKKKKAASAVVSTGTPESQVAPVDAVRLLENRVKLLNAFQAYIPPLCKHLASDNNKLISRNDESQVLGLARQTGSWLPLPQLESQSTEFARPLPDAHPIFPQ